eukprot:m.48191 g.48191  ORF g.48191 m.48191 type:complete len:111 (+) comp47686_c0_seq5:274-606(+)
MCLKCVSEKAPDRGTTCNDTGAFMMNYLGCIECKSLQLVSTARQETEEDGEELLEFAHTCQNCNHKVATHKYTFYVRDSFQEFSMTCILCGRGAHSASVMPNDPRQEKFF